MAESSELGDEVKIARSSGKELIDSFSHLEPHVSMDDSSSMVAEKKGQPDNGMQLRAEDCKQVSVDTCVRPNIKSTETTAAKSDTGDSDETVFDGSIPEAENPEIIEISSSLSSSDSEMKIDQKTDSSTKSKTAAKSDNWDSDETVFDGSSDAEMKIDQKTDSSTKSKTAAKSDNWDSDETVFGGSIPEAENPEVIEISSSLSNPDSEVKIDQKTDSTKSKTAAKSDNWDPDETVFDGSSDAEMKIDQKTDSSTKSKTAAKSDKGDSDETVFGGSIPEAENPEIIEIISSLSNSDSEVKIDQKTDSTKSKTAAKSDNWDPDETVFDGSSDAEMKIDQKTDSSTKSKTAAKSDNWDSDKTVFDGSSDAEGKTDQKTEENPEMYYRDVGTIFDSDSDSDSDDSSVNNDNCILKPWKNEKQSYSVIKVPGEMMLEELPPIEELHITVPSSLCKKIGVVTSIVQTLVVVQSIQTEKDVPALDIESVLFLDNGSRALGAVFDVFGPVKEPLYCVRFNSAEHIAKFNVNPGDQVYFAPETEHSKSVHLENLLAMRGSDASRNDDIENTVNVEFSDDEEEKKAMKGSGGKITAEGDDLDQLKCKRGPTEVPVEGRKKFKKFATQFPPRNNGGRSQSAPRGRATYCHPQPRPAHPRQEGPIHPAIFNYPPPPIPGTSTQYTNPPIPQQPYNDYSVPQGNFNNQAYQNPTQHNSFGPLSFNQPQVPQPQVDPRIFQFGAQFAQMVCNLQNTPPTVPVNVPPPSVSIPPNQPMYSCSQNNYNPVYNPPTQNPQTHAAPPFSCPPPMTNMPLTNVPPPIGQPPYPQQHNMLPNQNPMYREQGGSTYFRYNNSQ